ncbi:MAG: thermonuclease family protein [Povalibacter sp.]
MNKILVAVCMLALWSAVALAHPGPVDSAGCHEQTSTGKRHCHPQRATQRSRYDTQHPPRAGDEGVFFGPLVSVTDGDTLHARIQGVVMEFRLADVDAPEFDQPYGSKARDELRSLVQGQQLVLVFVDVDRYGRIVADVWAKDVYVNRELAQRGAVWFYAQYARNNALFDVEEAARDAKRGLWSLPNDQRVEPWIWRERKRKAANQQ